MSYRYIWEESGVTAKFFDATNSFEAAEMLSRLSDDHRFPSLQWRINDFLDVTAHVVKETGVHDIEILNSVNLLFNEECLTAVVVKRTDIQAIVKELMARHPRPSKIAMFETVDGARQWIFQELQQLKDPTN